MKAIGVFDELVKSQKGSGGSLRVLAGGLTDEDARAAAVYLKSGVPVLDIMEMTRDPLHPDTKIPGGSSLMSDGHWVWRQDLAYFVERYRVQLPEEFLRHVRSARGGRVDESSVDIGALWEAAMSAYQAAESCGN